MVAKNNFCAALLMVLHSFAGPFLLALVKLVAQNISTNQVVFFYKLGLLFILAPCAIFYPKEILYTKKLKTYFFSSIIGTVAALLFIYSLKYISLANATILTYMEKIFLVLMGVFYFKDSVTKYEILAIAISVIGAVIIVFPNLQFTDVNAYYIFTFIAVVLWALYCLCIKFLGKSENYKTQTFYTALFSTIISFPAAFIDFKNFSLYDIQFVFEDLPLFCLIAVCYMVLIMTLFKALQMGDLAIVAPFAYTKIVFSGILGFLIFDEVHSFIEYVGYLLIVSSSWYLVSSAYKKKPQ